MSNSKVGPVSKGGQVAQSEHAWPAPVAAAPIGQRPGTPADKGGQQAQSIAGVGHTTGVPTGKVRTKGKAPRPSRKARLRIAKLDPWSVMKTALMFSIAAAIMLLVAVALLWGVIEASGMLDKVQDMLDALLGNSDGTGSVQVSDYIDRWRVLGFTAVVCFLNVILLTALATLGAFLYNLSSSVLGGLDVTLAED